MEIFECEKVDLTAEIKISKNVLSLLGAPYSFAPQKGSVPLHVVSGLCLPGLLPNAKKTVLL